ncbi:MAG: M16 family metallopeptidase [Phycisphaerae bacterium]
MSDPYTLHRLENGLRIVIETMPDVSSAAAGFLVDTGARDEVASLAGVSHFLEHMMFKGTPNRTWRDVTIDFDRMGSSYNAYTSEERTIFYGWVRKGNIEKQIELLADMLRSTIPPEEFDTEKKVVLEEIAMSKDSLEHVTFDFLQEKVFAGHTLAWPILGYEETVQNLTRDQMWAYFQRRYAPDNIILVVAGNVDPQAVIGYAEESCGAWASGACDDARTPAVSREGTSSLTVDQFNQQVVALSFPAVGSKSPLCETAAAAASILGGENSRFYWNIIQAGLAPTAGAYHLSYSDCGLMILYTVGQPENAEGLLDALRREAESLCTQPVAEMELQRVKNKRRTGLAIEAEVPYHRLSQLMDDMQIHGAPRTVQQMLAEVDAITVDGIGAYLAAWPIDHGGHLVSVGPRPWLETNGATD